MGTVLLIALALFILYIALRYLKGSGNSQTGGNNADYTVYGTDVNNTAVNNIDGGDNSDSGYSDDSEDSSDNDDSSDSSDNSDSGGGGDSGGSD